MPCLLSAEAGQAAYPRKHVASVVLWPVAKFLHDLPSTLWHLCNTPNHKPDNIASRGTLESVKLQHLYTVAKRAVLCRSCLSIIIGSDSVLCPLWGAVQPKGLAGLFVLEIWKLGVPHARQFLLTEVLKLHQMTCVRCMPAEHSTKRSLHTIKDFEFSPDLGSSRAHSKGLSSAHTKAFQDAVLPK